MLDSTSRFVCSTVALALVVIANHASAGSADGTAGREETRALASGWVVQDMRINPATGTPRLLRLAPDKTVTADESAEQQMRRFLARWAPRLGVDGPTDSLQLTGNRVDRTGARHLSLQQTHGGVPVFGAVLRLHFNSAGVLSLVNGTVVSGLGPLSPVPAIPAARVEDAARMMLAKESGRPETAYTLDATSVLYVYRQGLARGVTGTNHLAWQVEVRGGPSVRELFYFDAHSGRLLNRVRGVHDLRRQIHVGTYPSPIWTEGDQRPYKGSGGTSDQEVNGLIEFSADVYDLFANLSGGSFLSHDGTDGWMHNVQNAALNDCPNASWDGTSANFCAGLALDDVVAHEWTHAYTDSTHDLIYEWQPGALNESYSDIFGEVVDLLNGVGEDAPQGVRRSGSCSVRGGTPAPELAIEAPLAVAGRYDLGDAAFNPRNGWNVSGELELVNDGSAEPTRGCTPLVRFAAGRIALMDRGGCSFYDKASLAQAAGAAAAIIVNNEGDSVIRMGGDGARLNIPSVFLGRSDGEALKAALAEGTVEVAVTRTVASDPSLRWLLGESDTDDPLRDMWNPACFNDPDRVSSGRFYCDAGDGGGVHTNSGIPNHAFALLVDGGTFNGVHVNGIGLTRAAHIYWRAMSVYQGVFTDFNDHADLLEQSCADLVGTPLTDLETGQVAGDIIGTQTCAQLAAALDAVEMRSEPVRCDFQPLLAPVAPGTAGAVEVFSARFDDDPGDEWTLTSIGVYQEWDRRTWTWTTEVPAGGEGGAFFAVDSPLIGDCDAGSDDQSGVLHLDSPLIVLPPSGSQPMLVFDHYMASESEWDGGNVSISVNSGPFQLLPRFAFVFNPYNSSLRPVIDRNTNPLSGQQAFTGSNQGTHEGSWGRSMVDLSSYAGPGDWIVIRFSFGSDGCNGLEGWYVDNVRVLLTDTLPRRGGPRVHPGAS